MHASLCMASGVQSLKLLRLLFIVYHSLPRNSTRMARKELCGENAVCRKIGKQLGKLKITRMSLIIIIILAIAFHNRRISWQCQQSPQKRPGPNPGEARFFSGTWELRNDCLTKGNKSPVVDVEFPGHTSRRLLNWYFGRWSSACFACYWLAAGGCIPYWSSWELLTMQSCWRLVAFCFNYPHPFATQHFLLNLFRDSFSIQRKIQKLPWHHYNQLLYSFCRFNAICTFARKKAAILHLSENSA